MSEYVLEVKNATKRFGGLMANQDISFNVKYGEIVDTQDETADKWYKCKIVLVTIDEASAKEKKTPVLLLVKAESVPDAISRLNIHMKSSVMDYELTSVNNSPIVDIFQYEAI